MLTLTLITLITLICTTIYLADRRRPPRPRVRRVQPQRKPQRQPKTGIRGPGMFRAVPVIDLDTGVTFPTATAADRSVGAPQGAVLLAIQRGGRCHGHRFAKLSAPPSK